MEEQYRPDLIEAALQQQWSDQKTFKCDTVSDKSSAAKETFYCLSMFPYPSGKLHMGHVRNYTIGDVISRYQAMQGKAVLQPMGWDAFGLPAENAAIKNQVPPAEWTYQNIDDMRGQLQRLGFAYDWDREIATCHPDYYRWEQWLFLRLYEKGLVYRKEAEVNWDPIDQTVLANEQVIDGRGWRSGALVERRKIPQWFLKITDYAEQLLNDLDQLDEWPEQVRTMQRNWIGRSEGVNLTFTVDTEALDGEAGEAEAGGAFDPALAVFTTRPDTLMGVTYVAVAPQHPVATAAAANHPEIAEFIEQCKNIKVAEADLATMEKLGIDTGFKAIHPITQQRVPIWIANFVLITYGSGAVMSVPAHDQRDWEFAKKYQLPIQHVIAPHDTETDVDLTQAAFTDKGVLINSGAFDGLTSQEAFTAIAEQLEAAQQGERTTHYRLRDWGVSRQRYWGAPIPIIYCDHCGAVPVPDDQLPVELPTEIEFDASGGSPIKKMPSFYKTQCPTCGADATRETDTFDTFMESSWYYARYTCPRNDDVMLDDSADHWTPVDQYVGGIEHAVLHLLYSRFFHKVMRDLGMVSSDEPFKRLLCQGMVVAETFYREEASGKKHFYGPQEVEIERDAKGKIIGAKLIADQQPVTIGAIEKMSKSKNNGVDPQSLIDQYGADTVRLFTMFAAPPDQSLEWSDSGVDGAHRFLKRLWRLVYKHQQQCKAAGETTAPAINREALEQTGSNNASTNTLKTLKALKALRLKTHETLKKASDDIGRRYTFNTAIASVMELTNAVSKLTEQAQTDGATDQTLETLTLAVIGEALRISLLILSPIAPHITQSLWSATGHEGLIAKASWPEVDEKALVKASVALVLQVNGKRRGQLSLPPETDKATIEALALEDDNVKRHIDGKTVRKVIVVPNKLINIVAN